jgi:hypothetical protein
VGQHVVAQQEVGLAPLVEEVAGQLLAEELGDDGNALVDGHRCDVPSRLDAQHGDAPGEEELQKVSVVAGQLHHQAMGAQAPPVTDGGHVFPGAGHEGARVGREVRVLLEDVRGRNPVRQLDEGARVAHEGAEGVEGFGGGQVARGHVGLAKRRHPQVHEDRAQGAATRPAVVGGVGRPGDHGRTPGAPARRRPMPA